MTVLIHLNGPPGVGKSTLAQRYADRHPGGLNLDIDHVVALIGGWQDDFDGTLPSARRIAVAMAETHLTTGHDVVVPQLVTALDQSERFQAAAAGAGADYVEVALLVGTDEQGQRFRGKSEGTPVGRYVKDYVEARGGDALLARIDGHLAAYLGDRPLTRRLVTDGLDPDSTYDALLAALH